MQQDNWGINPPRDGVMYDPNVRDFDTSFWKKLAGTVAVTGSVPNKAVRFTNGDAISFSQYKYGVFDYALNIPNTPSGSEARKWGLLWPSTVNGGIYFEISGSVFQVVTTDDLGNTTTSAVTFVSAWAGSEIIYRIIWTPNTITFTINDIFQKTHTITNGDKIPTIPMPLRIDTNEADNVDLGYLLVKNAGTIIS